jgi:hypoxia up-regulated 1
MRTLCIVLLCAIYAEAAVIGIDFGSEYFKVSLIRPGKKLLIVENLQSKRMTPTMIGFAEDERVFGEDAQNLRLKNPDNTLAYLKRTLGVSFNNTAVAERLERELQSVTFYEEPDRLGIVVKVKNQLYASEEIIAMILEFVRKLSEKAAEGSIQDCAITVPAYWTRAQRLALIGAAQSAKLNVISLIHENTAAAFYYGIDRLDNTTHHAIFYNLGASDLQVAVVKYDSAVKKSGKITTKTLENIEVLSHAWDENLGGLTFDTLIANYIADDFKTKTGQNPRESSKAMAKLMVQANTVKKVLSASKFAPIIINNLYKGYDYSGSLEREKFEAMLEPYLDRLIAPVNRALEQAGLTIEDIDNFEIIGGVSRIPKVQEVIKKQLGKDVAVHLNGDEAMAHGTAIYAANFTSDIQVKPIWLTDITTSAYYAEFLSVEDKEFYKTTELFKADAKLGSKKKVSFTHDKDLWVRISANYGGTMTPILMYNVTGVENMSSKYETAPLAVFTFILDTSGLVDLVRAEGKLEIEVEMKRPKNNTETESYSENTEESEQTEQFEEEQESEPETTDQSEPSSDSEAPEETPESTEEIEYEYYNTTKPIRHDLTAYGYELEIPHTLTESLIKKIRTRIDQLNHDDEERKRTAEAKNELEGYIYYMREKLDEENFQQVTTEDQRSEFSQAIDELSGWIETDEFAQAQSEAVLERKRKFSDNVKDALDREQEFINRETEVRNAFARLEELQKRMKDLNYTKTWVPQEDKDAVFKKIEETKQWLDDKVHEQAQVANYETPVLKIATIESKIAVVERKIEQIKKIPRPKEVKKQKDKPDFVNFGEGVDWSKIKMENVKINGEDFSYNPESDNAEKPEEKENTQNEAETHEIPEIPIELPDTPQTPELTDENQPKPEKEDL